jgi:hypothetical protein
MKIQWSIMKFKTYTFKTYNANRQSERETESNSIEVTCIKIYDATIFSFVFFKNLIYVIFISRKSHIPN